MRSCAFSRRFGNCNDSVYSPTTIKRSFLNSISCLRSKARYCYFECTGINVLPHMLLAFICVFCFFRTLVLIHYRHSPWMAVDLARNTVSPRLRRNYLKQTFNICAFFGRNERPSCKPSAPAATSFNNQFHQ